MVCKIRSKELSVKAIAEACNTDQFTVNQWRRELGKKKPPEEINHPAEPIFAQLTMSDTDGSIVHPTDDIRFHCRGFDFSLPANYPVEGVVQILKSLDVGS